MHANYGIFAHIVAPSAAVFRPQSKLHQKPTITEAYVRVGALDSFIGYDRDRRHELLAHIHGLRGTAVTINDDQLAFDVDLPVPTHSDAITSLDLRGRTQTDLELRDLHLAVNSHQMTRFHPLFQELGVTPASKLGTLPGGTEVLIAGVRRATNTPPMRGGRRVVFVSLDDGTGLVSNVVFFHDTQERVGGQVFATNYMLVRGWTSRSGAKGVSVTGENLWDLFDVARQAKQRQAAELVAAEAELHQSNVHQLRPTVQRA